LIVFDKMLLGIVLLLIGLTMFLYHKSTKENSSFWYGKWRDFVFWERAQKHRENEDNHT
jgi:hypothetical protein